MKTKLAFTLAIFITMLSVLSHAQTGDILAPEKSPTPPPIPYLTLDALIAATKNGEIPEQIKDWTNNRQIDAVGRSVVAILCQQLHVSPKDLRYDTASDCGLMLSNLTQYELNNHDENASDAYKNNHKGFSRGMDAEKIPQFVIAFDTLAKQYLSAVDDYIALKKAREDQQNAAVASQQATQKTQDTAAKEAIEAAVKARQQKLNEVLDSQEYKRWQAALKVEEGEKMLNDGQKVLDHDNAVVKASGVSDLAVRRSAGDEMVAGKILLDKAFAEYKQLGGPATKPEDVHAGIDPAEQYR